MAPSNSKADVTCIIPVYNRPDYVIESIDSVLNQSLPIERIIVVNDGSTDHTLEALARFGDKIDIINKEHSGISETNNAGIKEVKTGYVAFLDSDDLWDPTKTEKQMAVIRQSNADLCFCHMEQFVSPELTAEERKQIMNDKQVIKGYSKLSLIASTSVFNTVGLFNPVISTGDFIDWFSRAREHNLKEVMMDEVLCRRRLHASNFMRSEERNLKNYTTLLRERLMRQRNSNKKA